MIVTRRARRGGFTLIELLAVIAILGTLTALAVGGYFRVRSAQEAKANEATLKKYTSMLANLQKAEQDKAQKEFENGVLPFAEPPANNTVQNQFTSLLLVAGGDRDRAKSLWMYLRLKNEFPVTFQEARAPTQLIVQVNNITHLLRLPPKKEFAKLPNTAPADAGEAAAQSAVILQIIVSERGTRGQVGVDDAVGATAGDITVANNLFRAFKDSWGQPIGYVRWATNEEIDDPTGAFSRKLKAPNPSGGPPVDVKDPLDTLNRFVVPNGRWAPTQPPAVEQLFRTACAQALFGPSATTFPNVNWVPTAISAGPNRKFEATQWPANFTSVGVLVVKDDTDDMLGYQFRRDAQ